MLEDFLTDVV